MSGADKTPLWVAPIEPVPPSADRTPLPIRVDFDDYQLLARGAPEPRPSRRPSSNLALRLSGTSIHMTVGLRPDGTVREFFVDLDMHKEGAPLKGAAHLVSVLASQALQRGVPLRAVCKSLRATFFEPAGVVTGHERITGARSLFDLVAQVLEDEDVVERERLAREKKAAA